MKRLLAIASILVAITGCVFVSATEIMESYVGKDIRDAVIDYGPPANVMDMGDGRRAFQWVRTSSSTTARTSGSVYVPGNPVSVKGTTTNSRRVYTLYGEWDESRNGWIVTGFEEPR